jgi:hypothetical protein
MFKSVTRLVLVATVLAAAIIPSVAAARQDGPSQAYSDAAAAFGAAGMLVLIAVSSGTVLAVRRWASPQLI